MKERPIIFSAPMIRALLAGHKTQTRRIVKDDGRALSSRFGVAGDRLWVKEAFAGSTPQDVIYRADMAPPSLGVARWKSSLFMPRALSRITLEVRAVRVERLHDISIDDALAEGFIARPDGYGLADGSHVDRGDARAAYFSLFDSINGAGAAAANPLVGVIDFVRTAPGPAPP